MFLVAGRMSKELNGILEQVFIDQAVAKLEQMKFELLAQATQQGPQNESFIKWCAHKVSELNELIVQFDQTEIGNNFNYLLNNSLDYFWGGHTQLDKREVLFCGVVATMSHDTEASEFLQIDMEDFTEKKNDIAEKLDLKSPYYLRGYVLRVIKESFDNTKM